MADNIFPCIDCGREYNHSKLSSCPGCSEIEQQQKLGGAATSVGVEDPTLAAIKLSIEAADRTTHAIRAFTSYFGVLITSAMIAGLVYLLGALVVYVNHDVEALLLFVGLAYIVIGVGAIIALSKFLTEWKLSKVPKKY